MAEIILMCGMICSGKSYNAKKLAKEKNAVILSTDEATKFLINNEQGDFYLEFVDKVNLYLRKKAVDIVKTGTNVILDWGFWTKEERNATKEFYKTRNIDCELHYIEIDDETDEQCLSIRILAEDKSVRVDKSTPPAP
jgi:predicted kinase